MCSTTSTVQFLVQPQVMKKHLGSDLYESPADALREIVANCLDADCHRIDIDIRCNDLGGTDMVTIADDGRGISPEVLVSAFRVVGRHVEPIKPKRDPIGSRGIGKFAVFRLAAQARWDTVAAVNGMRIRQSWTMDGATDTIEVQREEAPDSPTGTTVNFIPQQSDDVYRLFGSPSWVKRHLFNDFASYMLRYRGDVDFFINGERLELDDFIESSQTEQIPETDSYPEGQLRHVLLGAGVDQEAPCILQFSAHGTKIASRAIEGERLHGRKYLGLVDAPYLSELTNTSKSLLVNMDPRFIALETEALDRARTYISVIQGDKDQGFLEEARSRSFYPFRNPPKSLVEQYSQDVFDNVLLVIEKHIGISSLTLKQQELIFRLTRQMMQSEDLTSALTSLLDLKGDDVTRLTDLLQRTSLSSIIAVSELLVGRFQFLDELEAMVYGKAAEYVKERRDLQKILGAHTWLFGEQYNLMGADISMNRLLPIIHENIRDVDDEEAHIEVDPKLKDIPDFYLLAQRRNEGARHCQHLVVELKRPSVRILPVHVEQLKRYASKIVRHPIFSQDTGHHRFTFILVSSAVSATVKESEYQANEVPGLISRPNLGHPTELWTLQWSDFIDSRRSELQFLRDKIEILADPQDLQYLRRTVGKHLPPEILRSEPNGHAESAVSQV